MTRIASLPVEQWDPELRALAQADSLPKVQQTMLGVYANAPALAKPFLRFTGEMSAGFTRTVPDSIEDILDRLAIPAALRSSWVLPASRRKRRSNCPSCLRARFG